MKPTHHSKLTRCNLVTAAILMTGFSTAVVIYLTSEEIPDNPFAEYEHSKRFSLEVQRMGGKLALVAHDISAWCASLWHGQQLAYTVACLTVVIAAGYYVIASGTRAEDLNTNPGDDDDTPNRN